MRRFANFHGNFYNFRTTVIFSLQKNKILTSYLQFETWKSTWRGKTSRFACRSKAAYTIEVVSPKGITILLLYEKLSYLKIEKLVYNNKQLLDEVEHDSENYQGRGLCYLPKPKAEADNTNRGLDNFAIMRKLNPIIVLLYNYKCTSVETLSAKTRHTYMHKRQCL